MPTQSQGIVNAGDPPSPRLYLVGDLSVRYWVADFWRQRWAFLYPVLR